MANIWPCNQSKGENIGVVGLLFCDLISLFTSLCRQWTNNQLAHGWLISVCKIKMKWWTKCGDQTDEYLVWKSHKTGGRCDLLLLYAHLSLPKLLSEWKRDFWCSFRVLWGGGRIQKNLKCKCKYEKYDNQAYMMN